MAQGPDQTDLADRKVIFSITFVLFAILCTWEAVAGVLSPLLLVGNLLVALAIAFAVQRLTLGLAASLVGKMYAGGNIAPAPSYSLQESMIVRGRYADAAESFRDHIAEHPEDMDARLALARLLEEHLRDYAGAARLYLEIRRGQTTPPHASSSNLEMAVANGLIDLCRKAGWVDRLRELDGAALTNESPRSPT